MFKKRGISFVFAFALIAVLMMSFVVAQGAVGTAPAAGSDPSSGSFSGTFVGSTGSESFKGVLSNILPTGEGKFFEKGGSFAKILIFALVALIVFSLTELIPFFDNKDWISGGFSIIVALLSTFWLGKAEIQTALFSYEPMAIALTALIPFFAIAIIAKKSFDKGHILFNKLVWIIFLVVLAGRFLMGWADGTLLALTGYTYLTVLVLSILMFFFGHKLYPIWNKYANGFGGVNNLEQEKAYLASEAASVVSKIKYAPTPAAADALRAKLKIIRDRIKRLNSL
jgi:hypothetical protein